MANVTIEYNWGVTRKYRFESFCYGPKNCKLYKRIIRDSNDKQLESGIKNPVLLPPFSCHSLRHTFTTGKVESNVNVKVVQEVPGHKVVSTTLDIYTDVTKEPARRKFDDLDEKLMKNMDSAD